MASGKTHDWVTLLCLPPVFWLSWQVAHADWQSAMLLTAGTWAGGFLLSPDLDTRSRPFYRWGIFRFIWWPYQWAFRHRSGWTHGVGIAAWLRLTYLFAVLILLYLGVIKGLLPYAKHAAPFQRIRHETLSFVNQHLNGILLFGTGVWLGGLIHIALDGLSSAWKRR